jgi:hypothetical protein
MKRYIWLFLALLAALPLAAQTAVPNSGNFDWTATTGVAGQVGNYVAFNNLTLPRPGNYTIDVSVSGTTPATCTFRVEGSADGTVWYGLDVTSPATTSCTASYMESIINRPVRYLRINATYTQGDTTTKVVFHLSSGRS